MLSLFSLGHTDVYALLRICAIINICKLSRCLDSIHHTVICLGVWIPLKLCITDYIDAYGAKFVMPEELSTDCKPVAVRYSRNWILVKCPCKLQWGSSTFPMCHFSFYR